MILRTFFISYVELFILRINNNQGAIISDPDICTNWTFGCGSFRALLECSTNFQGVAPAPVRPVWGGGTHDSGGIFPPLLPSIVFNGVSLSVWRLCERVRARGEGGDREKREADI